MRKQIAAVAVVALLVFAGCSAAGGGGPVYESPLNGTAVAQNHDSAVREAGSFTLVSTSNQTQGNLTVSRQSSTAVDLASGAFFSNQTFRGQTIQQYGDGNGTAYQRVVVEGGQDRYSITRRTPNASQLVGGQLSSFVGLFAFSHAGTERVNGTDVHVYEASGVEDVNESAPGFANLDTENITSVGAYVNVTDDGLVTAFGYSISIQTGNGEASIAVDQQYVDVGSTTVEEPAWLDEARANTTA